MTKIEIGYNQLLINERGILMFLTLFANEKGEVLEHPGVGMLGRSGSAWVVPENYEMIPLPRGASLVNVPACIPVGLDSGGQLTYFDEMPGSTGRIQAVAALLPQGFTRTLMPACVKTGQDKDLPLLGYAAVGLKEDKIFVAAVQSDVHRKWHPVNYNTERLPARIARMLKKYPQNRILRQLAGCSLEYSCFTAQNIFYQRWEGGIPTMPRCNANCIGCISESHLEVNSPQQRLNFNPEIDEIVEIGTEHLTNAKEAIISFGQGCEGEPSLNAKNLSGAVKLIRQKTFRGTININTNAGYTEGIKQLCEAGLDAMRVTIFSCNEENYRAYHRPLNYSFKDVENSVAYAKDKGVKVSVNLLTFPGFTDREEEIEDLLYFIKGNNIDMLQLRNLNIDPDYLSTHFSGEKGIGIVNFINLLKEELPALEIGSYSHPVR